MQNYLITLYAYKDTFEHRKMGSLTNGTVVEDMTLGEAAYEDPAAVPRRVYWGMDLDANQVTWINETLAGLKGNTGATIRNATILTTERPVIGLNWFPVGWFG